MRYSRLRLRRGRAARGDDSVTPLAGVEDDGSIGADAGVRGRRWRQGVTVPPRGAALAPGVTVPPRGAALAPGGDGGAGGAALAPGGHGGARR
jgi:hypothetical protein